MRRWLWARSRPWVADRWPPSPPSSPPCKAQKEIEQIIDRAGRKKEWGSQPRHMAIGHVVSPAGGEEFLEEVCLAQTCPATARARLGAARQHQRSQHSIQRTWPSASDETGLVAADASVALSTQLLSSSVAPCSQQQKLKKARESARATVRKRLRPIISASRSGETAPLELKARHPALVFFTLQSSAATTDAGVHLKSSIATSGGLEVVNRDATVMLHPVNVHSAGL